MSTSHQTEIFHLTAGGVSVVVHAPLGHTPTVQYWGGALGECSEDELEQIVATGIAPVVSNSTDHPLVVSVVPEQSRGWMGQQGLLGNRRGTGYASKFAARNSSLVTKNLPAQQAAHLVIECDDDGLGLGLTLEFVLTEAGLLQARATVVNRDSTEFELEGLNLFLPVPTSATELLDFSGRHMRERAPQRTPFNLGSRLREGRRGRTGIDSPLLLIAGTANFGFRSGEVWATHLGWSGNYRMVAERSSEGVSIIGGGELLLSGEVRLAPQHSYTTPWQFFSYGVGLDNMSAKYHAYLRAGAAYPARPRPITLNTWEAAYFDQSLEKFSSLIAAGAEVGAERFVLDDGWFGGRRADDSSLGDWIVSPDVWPNGLGPLIAAVHEAGMEFGLWFEPEMINMNSDLARAHPDWIMATSGRHALTARTQHVLNLANPAAYQYILTAMDTLLSTYDIAYIKWDHNRDLVDAGRAQDGRAVVHEQTHACYRLLAELRSRHPKLEIESCAGGGGRVDLGVLSLTQRIWASDCIDPQERQQIQRWTGLLVPPEYLGSHVGSPVAHTTGRPQPLDYRAVTALLGHMGIEWHIGNATAQERAELKFWLDVHKRFRPLIHSGTLVHGDHGDQSVWSTGVVSSDRSEALYVITAVDFSEFSPAGRITLPGLDPAATYRLAPVPGTVADVKDGQESRVIWLRSGTQLSGQVLEHLGVHLAVLRPGESMVLHAQALSETEQM